MLRPHSRFNLRCCCKRKRAIHRRKKPGRPNLWGSRSGSAKLQGLPQPPIPLQHTSYFCHGRGLVAGSCFAHQGYTGSNRTPTNAWQPNRPATQLFVRRRLSARSHRWQGCLAGKGGVDAIALQSTKHGNEQRGVLKGAKPRCPSFKCKNIII